jgi:hypothetical protein
MIAHLAGVPVEEFLLPALASGAGAVLVLTRIWVASHVPLRQSRETGTRSGNVRPWAGREVDRGTRMS